jgi:DNA-binding LacI/PurR family transcriptional regulator
MFVVEHNLAWNETWLQESGRVLEGGYEPTRRILAQQNAPTALLVMNYRVACGVVRTIQEHGMTVGRDMSVLTMSAEDDSFKPSIDRMQCDPETFAGIGVRILMEKIANPEGVPIKVHVPYVLIKGKTCGPLITNERR